MKKLLHLLFILSLVFMFVPEAYATGGSGVEESTLIKNWRQGKTIKLLGNAHEVTSFGQLNNNANAIYVKGKSFADGKVYITIVDEDGRAVMRSRKMRAVKDGQSYASFVSLPKAYKDPTFTVFVTLDLGGGVQDNIMFTVQK